MAIQFGTVDGLVNITKDKIQCFVRGIEEFVAQGGPNYAKKKGIAFGAAFQRYIEPVYVGDTKSYTLTSIDVPVYTNTGAEQSPARITFCKKMGLLKIDESSDIFEITPLGKSIIEDEITIKEYAFILLSKMGVFKDGVYADNLLNIISLYFQSNATISQSSLKDFIVKSFNESNIIKTRFDIIINALTATGLITKVSNDIYVLSGTGQAELLADYNKRSKSLSIAEIDTSDEYSNYIGNMEYGGVFDVLSNDNIDIYTKFFPNIRKYLKTKKDMLTSSNKFSEIGSLQRILFGPPGTGKTHKMQLEYIDKFAEEDRFVTTFHQSFSYEEFVEGLKPVLDDSSEDVKYHIEKGIFYKACDRAAVLAGYASLKDCVSDTFDNRAAKFKKATEDNKLVLLCIDEINRGNIAAILGDLISLIEESKRLGANKETEMIVSLPYSQEKFGVPANLLIIGTMNTADRSIQLLDSALRRRFTFEEMLPDYDEIENENARKILEGINARIRCLLSKDAQIGHSYLMHAKTSKDILDALVNKIIPLLEEYFYNDIQKVRFILNETEPNKNNFYVEDEEAKKAFQSYISSENIDEEDKEFYKFNELIKDILEGKANNANVDFLNEYIKNLLGN